MKRNYTNAWITWEKQVRNKGLSQNFNTKYYMFDYEGSRVTRYARCIYKTPVVLYGNSKGYVFVQNPSLVLSLLAVILKPFFRYVLVVDAHNAAIFPVSIWLRWISKFVIKQSDFTIVTNQNLAKVIHEYGGSPLILPDPLPTFHNAEYLRQLSIQPKKVFFICSWASDEPYLEVFKAAELLPAYTFYFTGKSKGKELNYGKPLPANVVLTGYLPDDEYHEMLATSEVILDLATREDCLVCGAYEATALERPFIVSNKKAIKAYFKSGCLYVDNTSEHMVNGIMQMTHDYKKLKSDVVCARTTMQRQWQTLFEEANTAISNKISK